MTDTIFIREFARREGVSDTLAHQALKQGRLSKTQDGRMVAALIGTPWRAGAQSANAAAKSAAAGLQSGGGAKGVTYGEALRLKENWLALLRRLEYEHKSGSLVELAVAQRVVFDLCREQRDLWLAWPAKGHRSSRSSSGLQTSTS